MCLSLTGHTSGNHHYLSRQTTNLTTPRTSGRVVPVQEVPRELHRHGESIQVSYVRILGRTKYTCSLCLDHGKETGA